MASCGNTRANIHWFRSSDSFARSRFAVSRTAIDSADTAEHDVDARQDLGRAGGSVEQWRKRRLIHVKLLLELLEKRIH